MENFKNSLIQITQNGMGAGDDELGQKLIANYLTLISEEKELPRVIVFYNAGVQLICSGSPVIDTLKTIEQKGCKLLACKTCLNHLNLLDKVEVGIAGTMMDIIELQKVANKVINL
ncbi:DsrE family protein [Sunxiuqinia elliptica]|uniref:Selenium metabolism protein YedF n=1 Tax=Sunxiuqinia elliptica TaxID=655355 RepID=A0A4V6PRT2_9BACT|nr:DsrE family protein [Sunxiuqinia elliptica]TDO01329.1 selenium metabolism protein YedF [Sunxiuqinia elliptica]TDO57840.1 selenium metabolism protein YedF [Sunxiuqinia elliptica]